MTANYSSDIRLESLKRGAERSKQNQDALSNKSDMQAQQRNPYNQKNKPLIIEKHPSKFHEQLKKSLLGQTMQVAPKFSNIDHSSVMREDLLSAKNNTNMS